MNSYNVLPIDSEDLKNLYATSKRTDVTNKEEVQYLQGMIEGVLGKWFNYDPNGESA